MSRRGRSASRGSGGGRGFGSRSGSRSRSASRSRPVASYGGGGGGRSSVTRRWTGYRQQRPRSYTRHYARGRPYQWYPRYYRRSGYWTPYAYRSYVDGYAPIYYRYPYYSYYVYTNPVVAVDDVIVNDVKQLSIAPVDPAAWASLPNRVIHDRGNRGDPVYLYCNRGTPTVVTASAATANRPVLQVDDVFYQCSQA